MMDLATVIMVIKTTFTFFCFDIICILNPEIVSASAGGRYKIYRSESKNAFSSTCYEPSGHFEFRSSSTSASKVLNFEGPDIEISSVDLESKKPSSSRSNKPDECFNNSTPLIPEWLPRRIPSMNPSRRIIRQVPENDGNCQTEYYGIRAR
jgi:hypothetical protein